MESSESKSEPKRISEHSRVRAFLALWEARREWEAKNPELAKAWNEALAEDDERARILEQAKRRVEPSALWRLHVPLQVIEALRSPRPTAALTAAKAWWLSGQPLLLLLGGVGSGKTTAAAWALQRKLEAMRPQPSGTVWDAALFVMAPEFDGGSKYRSNFREWIERLCRCGFLVLDDLGTEQLHDGEQAAISRVISERIARGRRTVLTSNLEPGAFGKRYDERLWDRIRESGMVCGSGDKSLRQSNQTKPEVRT